MTTNDLQYLPIEQFAQRLQISRATVFAWIKNGEISEGVHYLRIGRILRLCWPFSFNNNQPPPGIGEGADRQPLQVPKPLPRIKKPRSTRSSAAAINLEY